MIGISRNHALRGYGVWTLRVRWDAERPDVIPPERAPIGRGTSMIHHNFVDKTIVTIVQIVSRSERFIIAQMFY